jgi:hypothetical protein
MLVLQGQEFLYFSGGFYDAENEALARPRRTILSPLILRFNIIM